MQMLKRDWKMLEIIIIKLLVYGKLKQESFSIRIKI